jgi:hypothetical protein
MSPSQKRQHSQRPPMIASRPVVPVLSLLLGLCLQPLSGSADPTGPVSMPKAQATLVSNKPSTVATVRQQVAPAVSNTPAPADKARPAVKPAPRSTLATTAETTSVPRKQVRPTKPKSEPAGRVRDAVAQVAVERAAEKRAQTLRDLLARAQLDYTEGRVFEPPNNNAAARYIEVLALDPTQPEALAATQRIADILAVEAEHVALAGDQPRTLQYILQIRALQPKHPSLQGLDARYQALLASPVVLSPRQQERYSRSAQSIDDAYNVLKTQPIGYQSLDRAIGKYDRAARLVRTAPGLPKLKDRIILAFPAATRAELAADSPRSALTLVQTARKRGWYTPELESLEEQAKRDLKAKWPFTGSQDP